MSYIGREVIIWCMPKFHDCGRMPTVVQRRHTTYMTIDMSMALCHGNIVTISIHVDGERLYYMRPTKREGDQMINLNINTIVGKSVWSIPSQNLVKKKKKKKK